MISSVSSTASSILSSTTTSSSSSTDTTKLEAELAEKKAALQDAQDDDEKAEIQAEISALEAQIAKVTEAATASGSAGAGKAQPAKQEALATSGESERIGSKNFDDNTPFGDRTSYI